VCRGSLEQSWRAPFAFATFRARICELSSFPRVLEVAPNPALPTPIVAEADSRSSQLMPTHVVLFWVSDISDRYYPLEYLVILEVRFDRNFADASRIVECFGCSSPETRRGLPIEEEELSTVL
jgi:hypothetical protein